MSNEEIVYLYQQGDEQALNKLIEKNRGIIISIVNKFYVNKTNSIDIEDLEQEGTIGLITAAKRYKLDNPKRAQFITYSVKWIYSKISRYVNQNSTNKEISLNTPIGDEEGTELLDYIEGVDYSYENIEEQLYNQQLRQELQEVMRKYNTLRQEEILKLRYGWDNNECMSFSEVGDLFNLTAVQIRSIEDSAFNKIRHSVWGRLKAKEIYTIKRRRSHCRTEGVLDYLSFEEMYL